MRSLLVTFSRLALAGDNSGRGLCRLRCWRMSIGRHAMAARQARRREIYYYFNPKKMKEVADWVSQYQQYCANKLDSLESYLAKIQKKKK
ncbi:MAG: hypothetical protein H7Y86_08520 [Rhizobacter sp.]|nr:hypothetical protein [Ferruginibacter sp.]